MLSVNVRDLTRAQGLIGAIPANLKREIKEAVQEIALIEIESKAKLKLTRDGHIDTGRLRASIHAEFEGTMRVLPGKIDELGAIVGTNVEYAKYVERIDSYLVFAFKKAIPKLKARIDEAVRRAIS